VRPLRSSLYRISTARSPRSRKQLYLLCISACPRIIQKNLLV